MAVYIITGKLGAGKTLVAVGKIRDKIVAGCKVATNLDLRLHKLAGININATSPRVMRIPDKPCIEDLEIIGRGNLSYDENKNGLLVFDECGTWFNTRSWADKERQKIIDWFLHARKYGWDIIFLVQDISIMDKQARVALAEHVVYCRRLDRLTVPFIGFIFKVFFRSRLPLPKVHIGVVKYGDSINALVVDRWMYTGKDLYPAYDTKQVFSDNYDNGVYSYLTPYLSHGRYAVKHDIGFYMRITKIYLKRISKVLLLCGGLCVGYAASYLMRPPMPDVVKTPSAPESHLDITGLKITSYRELGDDIGYTFMNAKDNNISTDDLMKSGFIIINNDACRVTLKKGNDYVQDVHC